MSELIELITRTAVDDAGAWLGNAIATLVLVALVATLRWFLASRVRASAIRSHELRRRWLVQVRNGCFLFLLFGLVIIWAAELQQLAISLLAIVVAIVLATKELILCLTGGVLRISSGAFAVGDRIEVNGIRGDVVDRTLMTTRLAELGTGGGAHQHTGRSVTLPNSLFLTYPVANDSELERFVLHTLTVPVCGTDGSWIDAEKALLEAAQIACSTYLDEARTHVERHARRQGLEAVAVEPRITLSFPDPGRLDMTLRVAAPAHQARRIEQEILRAYLVKIGAGTSADSA